MVKRVCIICSKSVSEGECRTLLTRKEQRAIMMATMLASYDADPVALKTIYESKRRMRACHAHFSHAAQFIGAAMTLGGYRFPLSERIAEGTAPMIDDEHIPSDLVQRLNNHVCSIDANLTLTAKDVATFMRDAIKKYYTYFGWHVGRRNESTLGRGVQEIFCEEMEWENADCKSVNIKEEETEFAPRFAIRATTVREEHLRAPTAVPVGRDESGSSVGTGTAATAGSPYCSTLKCDDSSNEMLDDTFNITETDPMLLNSYFLVQGAMLLQLFLVCQQCCTRLSPHKVQLSAVGTAPIVHYYCPCCALRRNALETWEGQSRVVQHSSERIFLGNSLCALAAITTGTRFNELQRWAEQLRLEFISHSFFYKWLQWCKPAIETLYLKQQQKVIETVRSKYAEGEGIELAADDAFDSREHHASIGKVSMVDLRTKLVLHTEVLHRSETNNKSSQMKLEGVRRLLRWIISEGWGIASLTTDRNRALAKMVEEMKDEIGEVRHMWDGWHLVKWFGNNLRTEMKRKDCQSLAGWYEKLKTHLWYAIEEGKGEQKAHIFNTCLHHVQHIHEWPKNELTGNITKCDHLISNPAGTSTLESLPAAIVDGTPVFERLRSLVLNETFQKDLIKASPSCVTSYCESKKAMDRMYCRKEIFYPLSTYKLYAMMSVMHFNNLRLHEIACEKTKKRVIQRKCREKRSRMVFKTDAEHVWREEIVQSALESYRQALENSEADVKNEPEIQQIIDAEANYDYGTAPTASDITQGDNTDDEYEEEV